MIESMLTTHGNEFASAVESKNEINSKTKELTMDNFREFTDHGLNGLRQLVEIYEAHLNDFVLDLVPFLTKFHHEYEPEKHSSIISTLKSTCSNKELVLVASEQLAMSSCPNTYPLLLPLFDLSQPYNANWLAGTLLKSVTESVICDKCEQEGRKVPSYKPVMECLVDLDISQCSKEHLEKFEKMTLFIVGSDKSLLNKNSVSTAHQVLGKLGLGFSSIMMRSSPKGWDPSCMILASYFADSVPLIYNYSWLFSNTLPWILLLLEEIGSFVEGNDVRPILDFVIFFSNKTFQIQTIDFEQLKTLFDNLITIAINNTEALNRKDSSQSITLLSQRLSLSDKLNLVKHYAQHDDSSVAGLFIDIFRSTLARLGTRSPSYHLLKTIRSLLKTENYDVLENSHRILATLSLIQLTSSSPDLRDNYRNLDVQFEQYTRHVGELVKRKLIEVNVEVKRLKENEISTTEEKVAATICVQGELVTELSTAEQLQSLHLARCRLDLVSFNLARTRDALDNFAVST